MNTTAFTRWSIKQPLLLFSFLESCFRERPFDTFSENLVLEALRF